MVFEELLEQLGREPVFETGFLLAGPQDPAYIQRQLAEWVATGKLFQLRRGLYTPAPPYQKVPPHPFLIANRLVPGSYVSLQAALAYRDLIPEHVAAVTSVTARRPGRWPTPFGEMSYRVIRREYIFGYERIMVTPEQAAFVATPEKALLDLIYLQPGGDDRAYLESLRLQNMERIDLSKLTALADRMAKPKLHRAARIINELAGVERGMVEPL
jgi:predicted transcriptional regulator of viral defense system